MPIIRISEDSYKEILKASAIDGISLAIGLDRLLAEYKLKIENSEKRLAEKPKEVIKEVMPTFPCSVCGKPVTLTKEKFLSVFKDWGHGDCIDKKKK